MNDSTTNKIFNLLTITEIKNMPLFVMRRELDSMYDYACNIDYILNPIASDTINQNISSLESILIHKEY